MGFFVSFYLLSIFLLSGLALRYGDRISFYLILMLPFFLYLHSFIKKERLRFPRQLTILWIGFSIFDFISTVLSYDHELSIERFLLYQIGFLTLIYFYNKKQMLTPAMNNVIVFSALVFTAASIFRDRIMAAVSIFDVNQIFNFYFPLIKGNNHLGIWLGMAIIVLLNMGNPLLLMAFIPFFLSAYSRSAYLGLFVALVAMYFSRFKKFISGKVFIPYVFVGLATVIFVFAVGIFVDRDDFLSDRPEYYNEAIMGFLDRPLIGYGPGNFTSISRKYATVSKGVFASNSHNLLLDILSGSGIFAFIFFCLFVFLILKNGKKNRNLPVFLFLLTVAVASYIFVMPSYMLLFFMFAGLSYEDNSFINISGLGEAATVAIFVTAVYLGTSEALYLKGDFEKSLSLYPFRKGVYESMIMQISPIDLKAKYVMVNRYKEYFPGNFEQIFFSADTYERMGDNKKALEDYMDLYDNGSGFNPYIVKRITSINIKLGNPVRGYYFAKDFINRVLGNHKIYGHMVNDTYDLCSYINKYYLDKGVCF